MVHAGFGELLLDIVDAPSVAGLLVVARDEDRIHDLTLAMRDGYSSVGSLGLGLPGARRLMDVFEIESVVGRGTTVVCIKWIG